MSPGASSSSCSRRRSRLWGLKYESYLPDTSRDRTNADRSRLRPNELFLDLLAEDSRLNVYAGKLEVRPPGALTTLGLRYSASAVGARLLGTILILGT